MPHVDRQSSEHKEPHSQRHLQLELAMSVLASSRTGCVRPVCQNVRDLPTCVPSYLALKVQCPLWHCTNWRWLQNSPEPCQGTSAGSQRQHSPPLSVLTTILYSSICSAFLADCVHSGCDHAVMWRSGQPVPQLSNHMHMTPTPPARPCCSMRAKTRAAITILYVFIAVS